MMKKERKTNLELMPYAQKPHCLQSNHQYVQNIIQLIMCSNQQMSLWMCCRLRPVLQMVYGGPQNAHHQTYFLPSLVVLYLLSSDIQYPCSRLPYEVKLLRLPINYSHVYENTEVLYELFESYVTQSTLATYCGPFRTAFH